MDWALKRLWEIPRKTHAIPCSDEKCVRIIQLQMVMFRKVKRVHIWLSWEFTRRNEILTDKSINMKRQFIEDHGHGNKHKVLMEVDRILW